MSKILILLFLCLISSGSTPQSQERQMLQAFWWSFLSIFSINIMDVSQHCGILKRAVFPSNMNHYQFWMMIFGSLFFFFPFPFSFPIPFLFFFFRFRFGFLFLFLSFSLSFSSPFPILSFPFLYSSFSFSHSSLMWILWSRCEASAWKNDKRNKNKNVWKNHLRGLGVFTRPHISVFIPETFSWLINKSIYDN